MNNTGKRRVRLTESQLKNVLTIAVKRVVNEARRRARKRRDGREKLQEGLFDFKNKKNKMAQPEKKRTC